MNSLLRRVGTHSWVVPSTEFTLEYCQVNCWFVAYRAGRPLFTAHNLAEAEEAMLAALSAQEEA